MNILHITTFLQGGAGKVIRDIALYQTKKGDNVSIITTASEETEYCNYTEYIDCFNKNNVKCYKIDSTFKRDIYLNLNVANQVKKIIVDEKIDIIHAHAAVPSMIGIIARSGLKKYIPIIQTMHGWGTNKKKEQENMDITILNSVDKVVAVSESDKNLLIEKGVNHNKIITIYNGVEEKSFDSAESEIINDISEYKSIGFTVFGMIGTISERKNQNLLIEAVNKIDRDKKIYCVFIGEGDLIKELQYKVDKYNLNDRIKFWGYRENASAYIKYFDYFVFTSLSEGLSIALLEGFRERVPIIASDIDTFKECIEDKITGYLFENNNITSLTNKLEVLIQSDKETRRIIIKNAYDKYIEMFQLDIMLDQYNNLTNNIINIFNNDLMINKGDLNV